MSLDLAGVSEAAAILGVTKQRAYQLSQLAAFPEPIAHLSATRVWLRSDLEAYQATRRRTPGRPTHP